MIAEYAIGHVSKRGIFKPAGLNLFGQEECYRSMFLGGGGGESGVAGYPLGTQLTSDFFVFDFDSPDNLLAAMKSAREFFYYLIETYKLDKDLIYPSFSGSKGFHITFSTKLAKADVFLDADKYVGTYKKFCISLVEGFTFADLSIYTPNRLIRVLNTKNNKSGYYKVPLTIEEFLNKGIEDILTIAIKPRRVNRPKKEITPNEILSQLWVEPSIKVDTKSPLSDYERLLKTDVPEGQRHNTLIRLVGHLKIRGIPQNETLSLLEAWNKQLSNPLPEKEVARTIESLYSSKTNEQAVSKFNILSAKDIAHENEKKSIYLLENLIGLPSLSILFGEEGVAKSLFVANLAIAVSCGLDKYLAWNITSRGNCILVDAEMDTQSVKNRFIRMFQVLSPEQRQKLSNLIIITEPPLLKDFW
ncbi:MAG: primase C-terminal domain-containing protein, partial [Bacteroidota bacterium]